MEYTTWNIVGTSIVSEIQASFWPTGRAGIEGQCRAVRAIFCGTKLSGKGGKDKPANYPKPEFPNSSHIH
mgnify:CR=1 FL=1